jgi:hypothetical protein
MNWILLNMEVYYDSFKLSALRFHLFYDLVMGLTLHRAGPTRVFYLFISQSEDTHAA